VTVTNHDLQPAQPLRAPHRQDTGASRAGAAAVPQLVPPATYRYTAGVVQRVVATPAGPLPAGAAGARTQALPPRLKAGIEHLSGVSMAPVTVHYNSPRPAAVDALAYAHGSEIHLGPGQERHLAHEAWHVTQQAQGRVPATSRVGGTALNDSPALEREADTMGERALRMPVGDVTFSADAAHANAAPTAPLQRVIQKPHTRTGEVFGRLTTPMIQARLTQASTAMVDIMKELHADQTKTYTWPEAVKEAKRQVKAAGRKVTGRQNRLNDHTDLLSYANSFGVLAPTLTTYVTKHSGVFDAALTELEFSKDDFGFSSTMTDNQMKTMVTDTMMAMPATLTRTMSAFNELADAEVLAHSVVGSAWKGNQFEQWIDANVFPTLKFRVKFSNSKLQQDRTCDGYDQPNDILWDYKHYTGSVPKDQAEDYHTVVSKKIASTSGYTPKKVCYLFSDKSTAQTNKWLNTSYGFEVWYVQTGVPPKPIQLY
jgi:hypothetical protein